MFSIFRKNTYLIDIISGSTDFHNHILPGIDDGAKTVDESVQLLNAYQEIGITEIVATPHILGEFYPNTPETIGKAYHALEPNVPAGMKLTYAAEYMMDQHLLGIIENKEMLPVAKNKVLVEMSYFQAPINLEEILFKLQNHSHSPILAHPERYSYWHSKDLQKYEYIRSRGCELQLNILSLAGHYGIGIQKIATKLLENNMIDYLGSDVHKIDHIEKIKNMKIPGKLVPFLKEAAYKNQRLFG